jgi:carboxyl-terminal processing protease
MRPLLKIRRVLGAVAAVAALGVAFTSGVVAGAGSKAVPQPAPSPPGLLDDAADQIADSALTGVDRQTLDAAAIQGMLRAAGDQWGSWAMVPPGSTTGYVGLGVWLRAGRSGEIVVARVSDGSSAALSGIRPGDEVRSVDAVSSKGLTAPVVAAAMRGLPGSSVTVITRRGSALRTLRLVRAAVPAAGVAVALERTRSGPSVGHITIPAFTRGTGHDVRAAVAKLRTEHTSGVVLDLRGNPGGLLDEAVETASAFLDGGTVVTYTRRDGSTVHLDAVAPGDTSVPLVVLVDGGTASAAEVVAGALQDRRRAALVGSRTFGKGTVQEPRTLVDGSALEITVARYATPAGRSLEGGGLEPDIEIAPASPPEVAVRRALDVLAGLVADSAPVAGGRG